MSENRTHSILQRVPVILAVTAASYGLPAHASAARSGNTRTNGTCTARSGAVVNRKARKLAMARH